MENNSEFVKNKSEFDSNLWRSIPNEWRSNRNLIHMARECHQVSLTIEPIEVFNTSTESIGDESTWIIRYKRFYGDGPEIHRWKSVIFNFKWQKRAKIDFSHERKVSTAIKWQGEKGNSIDKSYRNTWQWHCSSSSQRKVPLKVALLLSRPQKRRQSWKYHWMISKKL